MQTQIEPIIRLLPEHVIDQIKAGEVVERPGHILKELLENSIDAKSSKIEIALKLNGLDLIHIKDNGVGINYNDLPMAFCRHATSKLENFDDIYNLHTFGFRGEALASLASVSKLYCRSLPINGIGGRIEFEGPLLKSHIQEPTQIEENGTEIYVKDLFFNTPARLKFIHSSTTEKNFLIKILYSYFIAHPEIEFHLKWDEEDKIIFPAYPKKQQRKRISDINKNTSNLDWLEYEEEYNNSGIKIFLSKKSTKSRAKLQYIFVNNRPIYDRQIQAITQNICQGLWPQGESGHFCIFIQTRPQEIDINIHPHKTQVRFQNMAEILGLLKGALKNCIDTQNKHTTTLNQNSSVQQNIPYTENGRNLKDLKPLAENYSFALGVEQVNTQNNLELEKIQNGLYLYKKENSYFLINSIELFKNYVLKNLEATTIESTPLLISIPLKCTRELKNKELSQFEKHGFEIDKINDSYYMLRSIPTFIEKFFVAPAIIQYFASQMDFNVNSLLTDQLFLEEITKQINSQEVLSLISQCDELEDKIMIKLSLNLFK